MLDKINPKELDQQPDEFYVLVRARPIGVLVAYDEKGRNDKLKITGYNFLYEDGH